VQVTLELVTDHFCISDLDAGGWVSHRG